MPLYSEHHSFIRLRFPSCPFCLPIQLPRTLLCFPCRESPRESFFSVTKKSLSSLLGNHPGQCILVQLLFLWVMRSRFVHDIALKHFPASTHTLYSTLLLDRMVVALPCLALPFFAFAVFFPSRSLPTKRSGFQYYCLCIELQLSSCLFSQSASQNLRQSSPYTANEKKMF